MADKTYRMTVSLSDGSSLDAGTFVAPQGPQGPAVVIGNLVGIAESNFTAEQNSVYLIKQDGHDGETAILSTRTGLNGQLSFFKVGTDSATITHYMIGSNGKFSRIRVAKITSGNVTVQELTPSSAKDIYYIKLK